MKNKGRILNLASAAAICILSFSAFGKVGLLSDRNLNFAAPVVSQAPTDPDTDNPIGSIAYDLATNTFKGLFNDGWGLITQGAYSAPTIQKFTSGSGTYTTPAGVLYIRVRLVGGGGGGGGSGANSGTVPTDGSAGGTTTFGSSLMTATGGGGGPWGFSSTAPAVGGTATINSPATKIVESVGSQGGGGAVSQTAVTDLPGGVGGTSPFQGAGSSFFTVNGTAGNANSGSGGGGAGIPNPAGTITYTGAGGASGGYAEAFIAHPNPTYAYSVGAGGASGSAGSVNGLTGGNGGSGVIIVEEYYQ